MGTDRSGTGLTVNRLKQAALALFLEAGYEGTSLSDIAGAVGIRTPSIYAHFKSKDQLFLQLLSDGIEEERSAFERMAAESTDEPMQVQLYRMFDFFTDMDSMSKGQAFLKKAMLAPPMHLRDQLRDWIMQYERETTRHLFAILDRGKQAGAIDGLTAEQLEALFYALVDGLLVEFHLYDSETYNRRRKTVRELFGTVLTNRQQAEC